MKKLKWTCPACGAPVEPDMERCSYCDYPLEDAWKVEEEDEPKVEDKKEERPAAPGRQWEIRVCPKTYLPMAVVSTLMCCAPVGVVAIVFASRVRKMYNMRLYDEAEKASRKAKKWAYASIVGGVLFWMAMYALGTME